MLEHKAIDHEVVNWVPGFHAALVRSRGFRRGTVPAMKLDGRRVQGTRAIARALDEARPEPPLYPADPGLRTRVEDAERWGDELLQPVPRRLVGSILVHSPELRTRLAREAGVPAAGLVGTAGKPVTWYFAHKVGATDAAGLRETAASLPALLHHADELVSIGTIGGEQRNAADFQILTTVRLLIAIEDLAPMIERRPAGRLALDLMPDYPTGVPAGMFPREWLELMDAQRPQAAAAGY